MSANTASPCDQLSAALSTAQSRYAISNARSLETHNEACHDFPGGNTRTVLHASPFPITFGQYFYVSLPCRGMYVSLCLIFEVRGRGCELTSLDGDVYIDFLGEFTAGIYGHSNEIIGRAISEAMDKGWNYGGPNHYERELARKVGRFSLHSFSLSLRSDCAPSWIRFRGACQCTAYPSSPFGCSFKRSVHSIWFHVQVCAFGQTCLTIVYLTQNSRLIKAPFNSLRSS